MPDRRRRRIAAVLALPLWLATFILVTVGARPASAGTVTTPTSCTNTVQAGTTALPITVTGAFTPASPTSGQTVTLSGATFKIDVPGTVLLAGYGLGLLSVGANNIPANVNVTILGSGTQQTSQPLGPIAVTGTTTITDPTPANKTSGDETATPLTVTANIPTSTWTATSNNVSLSLGNSTTTAEVGPGGIIKVTFTCTPGTPTPAGCGPAPAPSCTGTNPVPAQPFATSTGGTTTTTTGGSTTTTTGGSTTTTTGGSTTTTTGGSTTTTTGGSTTTTTAPAASPGFTSYATTCTNSVTPDVSEMVFEGSARASSSGTGVSLTNQSWKLVVPASVLQTGMNLGLLRAGDVPAGTVTMTIAASGTREGNRTAAPSALTVPPIAVGADGKALPATATFTVANLDWSTSGAGTVNFSMNKAVAVVKIGPIEVSFTCTPKAPVATLASVAAQGGTSVAGVSSTRQGSGTLARTGPTALAKIVLAAALIDVGYLCWSATRPRRRQRTMP